MKEPEAVKIITKINKYIEILKAKYPNLIGHHICIAMLEVDGIGVNAFTVCPKSMSDVFSELVLEQANSLTKDVNKKNLQ